MKLNEKEFKIVNSPILRLFQKHLEFPIFRRMGFVPTNKSILEIGCGSGHGALQILRDRPASYIGVDIMPEQIQLAQKRSVKNCVFKLMDASDLSYFPDKSKDIVVICRILHHMPEWKKAIKECSRVLKPGGYIYITEPYGTPLKLFNRLFNLGHPKEAMFSAKEFNRHMKDCSFIVEKIFFLFPIFAFSGKKENNQRTYINQQDK